MYFNLDNGPLRFLSLTEAYRVLFVKINAIVMRVPTDILTWRHKYRNNLPGIVILFVLVPYFGVLLTVFTSSKLWIFVYLVICILVNDVKLF